MRTWMWLVLLAGFGSAPVLQGQSAAAPAPADVMALEEQWAGALRERNDVAFGKLLAEDLRHVGFEGQIVGKREYMAFFNTSDWRYTEYSLVAPKVTIEAVRHLQSLRPGSVAQA